MERINRKQFLKEAKEKHSKVINEGFLVSPGQRSLTGMINFSLESAANVLTLINEQLPGLVEKKFGCDTELKLVNAPRHSWMKRVFEVIDGKLEETGAHMVAGNPVVQFTYLETDEEYNYRLAQIVAARVSKIQEARSAARRKAKEIKTLKKKLEDLENGS